MFLGTLTRKPLERRSYLAYRPAFESEREALPSILFCIRLEEQVYGDIPSELSMRAAHPDR